MHYQNSAVMQDSAALPCDLYKSCVKAMQRFAALLRRPVAFGYCWLPRSYSKSLAMPILRGNAGESNFSRTLSYSWHEPAFSWQPWKSPLFNKVSECESFCHTKRHGKLLGLFDDAVRIKWRCGYFC